MPDVPVHCVPDSGAGLHISNEKTFEPHVGLGGLRDMAGRQRELFKVLPPVVHNLNVDITGHAMATVCLIRPLQF